MEGLGEKRGGRRGRSLLVDRKRRLVVVCVERGLFR